MLISPLGDVAFRAGNRAPFSLIRVHPRNPRSNPSACRLIAVTPDATPRIGSALNPGRRGVGIVLASHNLWRRRAPA
jgi:hypothetical protein